MNTVAVPLLILFVVLFLAEFTAGLFANFILRLWQFRRQKEMGLIGFGNRKAMSDEEIEKEILRLEKFSQESVAENARREVVYQRLRAQGKVSALSGRMHGFGCMGPTVNGVEDSVYLDRVNEKH